jgi:hypothetical protein
MPDSANVDAEGFEIQREKKRVADGENAYHARDKQLTCSDQQTDATSTIRRDFQGAAKPPSCHHSRRGTCAVFEDSAHH